MSAYEMESPWLLLDSLQRVGEERGRQDEGAGMISELHLCL